MAQRPTRPEPDLAALDGAPLLYEPVNEMGVVAIFAGVARRLLGITIEHIRSEYPDCLARRRGQPLAIEIEYRSSNFVRHRHHERADECDAIVCWIHDYPDCPEHIEVIELRRHFGLGFNVWVAPMEAWRAENLPRRHGSVDWSVSTAAGVDDLVCFYEGAPNSYIREVFRITKPPYKQEAGYREGDDVFATLKRVATLNVPLTLDMLRADRSLRHAPFVKQNFRQRARATPWWPQLRRLAVEVDSRAEKLLADYPGDRAIPA